MKAATLYDFLLELLRTLPGWLIVFIVVVGFIGFSITATVLLYERGLKVGKVEIIRAKKVEVQHVLSDVTDRKLRIHPFFDMMEYHLSHTLPIMSIANPVKKEMVIHYLTLMLKTFHEAYTNNICSSELDRCNICMSGVCK